jgi:tetratricopeptide (TPR) repeat protein
MQIKTISAEPIEIGGQSLLAQIVRGKLVGRDAEIGVLQSLWSQVRSGKAQLVLISGEPGVGKTRLANELIANSRLRGAQILRGGCYEYEASVPYLPFTEALRDWVHSQSDESLRVGLQDAAAELSKLAPEIESRIGPLTPNPQLSPDEERLRLFDNVARFLDSLSEPNGMLIFIDDLHWADRVTLSLLHYLLRRLREKRILILGAYREVELDRSHPLAASLVAWNRERLVTRIQLDRLNEEQCGKLLASMFGQEEVSKEFTKAIYCETEGNPFFIEEVIKSLIEGGQIYRENGGWGRGDIMDLAIPQSVKEAIGRRLDRLDEGSISVLHHAAILGKTFDFYELKAVISVGADSLAQEDSILDALDMAGKAQLIQPGKGESFVFTHDKIREVLYEELNPVRRRRLHRRLAEGLERLYVGNIQDVPVQDLAYHFIQSGELEKGMDYALQAAEKARQLYAHEEALDYLQTALESAEELHRTESVAEIHEIIGDVQSEQGLPYLAVESYQKSLNLATTEEKRASLKNSIGKNLIYVGDDLGITYLRQANDELDPKSQVNELAINLSMQGRYNHYKAQHAKAIEYLEQARQLAEPLDDAETLMNVYAFLAGAYQHLAKFDESNRWAQKSIALGERKDYPAAVAAGYEFIAENNIFSGDWKAILAASNQDLLIGEKIGSIDRVAWAKFGELNGLYEKGDLRSAKSAANDCLTLAEQIGENRLQIWLGGMIILIDEIMGDHDSAHTRADSYLLMADEIGQVALQCWIRSAAGFVSLHHGDWKRALELGRQGVELYSPTDNHQSPLFISRIMIPALHAAGKLDEAKKFAGEYLSWAKETGAYFYEGLILREQGWVLSSLEDLESALESFDQSVSLFERLDCRLELAFTLHNRALFHEKVRRADMARADAKRAAELFDWCGTIAENARAGELLSKLA